MIADGGVRRDATLGLAALRLLHVGKDKEKTLALRRYILGLALVAFTYKPGGYLRQGCLLVLDPSRAKENEFVEVHPTGERKHAKITHDAALTYAEIVAKAFGVTQPSGPVPFDTYRARADVRGEVAQGNTASGKISAVDAAAQQFTIGTGGKKVVVPVGETTKYFKGDVESNFAEVVVKGAKVSVELADGVAVKVSAQ